MSQIKNNEENKQQLADKSKSITSVASSLNITYPTGNVQEDRISRVYQLREATPAHKSSVFFISEKFESLDYIKPVNQLEVEKDKTRTYRSLIMEGALRILYFMIAGILTAGVGVFVQFGVMILGNWKFAYLSNYIEEHFDGTSLEKATMVLFWFLGSIIPIMLGSMLVVFIAPYAAGGGVAQCVAYLNGVRVPKVLSIKGFMVKAVSTIFCCISGLAGGKEGPMMHLGAIMGGSLPSALPWQVFKSDHERRDLAAAGFGAGIAVAFGAPIGGLLLALEEGISFWDISLMWKTYLCILTAYFIGTIFLSFIVGKPGHLSDPELVTFGKITGNVTDYELVELLLFALMGVIGGLSGASLIKIHVFMTMFRRRFVQTRLKKLTESFIVSLVVAGLSLSAVMFLRECSTTTKLDKDEYENKTRHVHQLYCEEGQYSDMSLMFFQTQEGFIHSMFRSDSVHILPLFIFCMIYFVLICLTMGLSISAGVFVPQIVLGAAWGRMFGTFLKQLMPNTKWVRPEKYAYVGAAAQLSATVGKTFSILVIMVEASRSINFSFPLMVIVSITKYVETFFVMPIYETQVHLMGMPFLPSQPPPVTLEISTKQVMSNPPLITLPMEPSVSLIVRTLKSCKHNGFPIVGHVDKTSKSDILLGLILRQQLLILLKYKAYKYPPPQTPKQMRNCMDLHLKEARNMLQLEAIPVKSTYYNLNVNLTPYYNPYPYTVHENLPFLNTYTLFRNIGLRHIIVINDNNEAIAMVTRKDLAKYHEWTSLCRKGVKEMLTKP